MMDPKNNDSKDDRTAWSPASLAPTTLDELAKFVNVLEHGRIEWPPELLAKAAAIEKRIRENPMSEDEIIAAGVAFITFTPLGGD
jgi:hypothetical protein